jgi:ankyrin repeat protein
LSLLLTLLGTGCSKPPEPTLNLYRAIQDGNLNQIQRHLYWGTDLNQRDPAGDTPLHVAARHGEVVITQTLLEGGARAELLDRRGRTPLYVALREGKTEVAQLLIRRGGEADPQALLFALVRDGLTDRDSLAYLQGLGANLDAADGEGMRPLHVATAQGNLLLGKRLIALGADIHLTDASGRTALQIATDGGQTDIQALLRRYGAGEAMSR